MGRPCPLCSAGLPVAVTIETRSWIEYQWVSIRTGAAQSALTADKDVNMWRREVRSVGRWYGPWQPAAD